MAAAWPNVDDSNQLIELAINNSMNNLLGYPIRNKARWPEYIPVPPAEVARVFTEWQRLKKLDGGSTGLRGLRSTHVSATGGTVGFPIHRI